MDLVPAPPYKQEMKRSARLTVTLIFASSLSFTAGLSGSGIAIAETQDAEWTRIWIAEVIESETPLPAEYIHHVGYVQRQTVQVRPLRTMKGPANDAVRSIEHLVFLSEPYRDRLLETGEHVTVLEQAETPTEPAFSLLRRLEKADEASRQNRH